MTQPGIGDLMSQWKQMSDQFMKNWGQVYESMAGSAEGQAMSAEMEKNYVAARAAMAKAARDAYGPIIEAVGAVPLSEFQRLSDQVHTIMLRMDKIDDAIQRLVTMQDAESKSPKTRKKKKSS
ncbi:MAG: hypothetical protein AB7N24_03265 [Dehalococcoidia bacterium]